MSSLPSGDQVGREVLVEARVVVAGQAGVAVLGEPHGRAGDPAAHVEQEHVEAAARTPSRRRRSASRRGTSADRGSRRRSWSAAERFPLASSSSPQLERVVAVGGVGQEAPVGRPVGLVVVAGAVRELARDAGRRVHPVEGALDRDRELAARPATTRASSTPLVAWGRYISR